jgi:hypothetical protein
MNRATGLALVLFALTAILPAAAQESGGLGLRGNQATTLQQINANTDRGCALSSTSVTVGVNKAFATGSSATEQLGTFAGAAGKAGCRPLVSTQIAVGANLALGRSSQAGQSIDVHGQRGALATTTFTRGVNTSVGAGSVAAQRIQNLTSR